MSFLSPKVPDAPKPPTPAATPITMFQPKLGDNPNSGYGSLITASPAGLRRKGPFNKTALIGGG